MAGLTTLTEREGIAGIAILAMFSDGIIAPEEDEVLRAHLTTYPPFEEISDRQLSDMLSRLELIAREKGETVLLDMSCQAVPRELTALAYLVAADIIAADGVVVLVESDFLRDLKGRLRIPEPQVEKIHREIEARS